MSAVPIRIAPAPRRRLGALVAVAVALAGCETLPPAPDIGLPPLRLLESTPLALPDAWVAGGSYVVAFTVDANGRTGNIEAPPAPPCVQQALSAWVASFRYDPPGRTVPTAVEWLLVEAGRGS